MSDAINDISDSKSVYETLDRLLTLAPIRIRKEAMAGYLDYFNAHCTKSKAMITEAQTYIPGGVQHNLAFNHPFPLVFDKAEGSTLYDIDGHRYLDFLKAGGPNILGANHPAVREQVIELLNHCGPVTGLFHEFELKLAREIHKHMPWVEMFRMLGSGTEAVMAALRVARLVTGKKNIIKIGGAYHGWSDQMVYSTKVPNTKRFEAHGIPRACVKYTCEARPNDLVSLERVLRMNRIKGGTAAVILEPIGPESGTRPVDNHYNAEVRKLCDQYGALLIFDEVVTGFRIGLGGAQGFYGVKPDMTVFGKVICGGYPSAGGLGGSKRCISRMAAGLQTGLKKIYCGGTLAANPLSAAAGYFTIKEIERTDACEKANAAGDRLTRGLQTLAEKYRLPFAIYNQGSICHLETVGAMFVKIDLMRPWTIPAAIKQAKARKAVMEEYGAAYMAEGLVTLAGSRLYTGLTDTDEVIDDALARFDRVFKNVDTDNTV
jgi:glutamate-1-semialdehyde 2,1-aminomutase